MARSMKQLQGMFHAMRSGKGSKWYSKVASGIQQKKYAGEGRGQAIVHHIMGKFKRKNLHSKGGKTVKNRKQAIAIALSTRAQMG